MCTITGFPAIEDQQASVLILGSMPSQLSLQHQAYYAHPRNAFWPIMFALFNHNKSITDYQDRKQLLLAHKVAVWDVLQSCNRSGSLDSAIKMESVKVNNFEQFLSTHPSIQHIFFNGAKAENIYSKFVLAQVRQQFHFLRYTRLPSTSPAYASLNLLQKTKIWEDEISYIIS